MATNTLPDAVDVVDRPTLVTQRGNRRQQGERQDADFDSFRQQSELVARRQRYVTPKDFELIRVIGMGAFGKVLQVRNKESKKVFAMKVISKRLLRKKGKGYIENILAEQQILSRVGSHPFIVSMHCSFQTREKLFIIMDFLAGGELFLRLGKEGIFLEKTAAFYLAEIILALDHLHTAGVLHRDLKPENILLGSDGHICLTDFGLAKDFGPGGLNDDEERANTICGTQEYMAPEMIARKGYGRAADYWSLGCIAYEMLSGLPPFSSKDGAKALFRKIMSDKVKMPIGTSAVGCKLLKGLLNRNVQARFGTARTTMFEIGGVAGLKQHPFFAHLNWDVLERKEHEPPAIFSIENDSDATHFHAEFTSMPLPRSVVDMSSERFLPRRVESDAFRGFSFVHDDFLLPDRDENEERTYWDSVEEDGESASECASSKMGEDEQHLLEVEPPKKRPPRKRKKKHQISDETQSKTASSTPLGSAVNTPEPSIAGDTTLQDTIKEDLVDNTVEASITNLEALSIKERNEKEVENVTEEAPNKQESGFQKPALTPSRPPKTVVESWQPVAKEKGKKKHRNTSEVKTPKERKCHPQSYHSTPPRQAQGPLANSIPSSNNAFKQLPTSNSATTMGWGSRQQQRLPEQLARAGPSRSTDWRQHSMRGSPRTTPKSAISVKPETIVWPSLPSSTSEQKPKPAAHPTAAAKLSGAWANRNVR